GRADTGYSTQAAFLDYDGDGDLDMFLIRNSPRPVSSIAVKNERSQRDPLGGHELYRNDGGHFVNVSEQAGIYGPTIGFGLGIAVADVNRDGRPDVYVANDFFERDYLYLNNGNGTFREILEDALPVSSYFSMGVDIADFDIDGNKDIFVANGLARDVTSQDYIAFLSNDQTLLAATHGGKERVDFTSLISAMTSTKLRNYAFRNTGGLMFTKVSSAWGLDRPSFSNGDAYGDLDGDGAPDLVVNNVN